MKKYFLFILVFFMMLFIIGCENTHTSYNIEEYTEEHLFFFINSFTCSACRYQLIELNKHWDEIKEKSVKIHIIMPGTTNEAANLKETLGLKFNIETVDGLFFHDKVGLTKIDENGEKKPSRGYAYIVNGELIESELDDNFGTNSIEIINKLLDCGCQP
ncbi:redoxin domain-containing protein [Caldalkalibacillus mannanilyticus]|uniref:redoxin domain-containing protein n=1 Tax=Caldalkalibacillus mannanilyticus TaxID=1418 RepID=UPI000468CD00|nr:redoxin domain-containing protein [Caldalkalibacillus mannanilyticus]